jgi:hypothetical protein
MAEFTKGGSARSLGIDAKKGGYQGPELPVLLHGLRIKYINVAIWLFAHGIRFRDRCVVLLCSGSENGGST